MALRSASWTVASFLLIIAIGCGDAESNTPPGSGGSGSGASGGASRSSASSGSGGPATGTGASGTGPATGTAASGSGSGGSLGSADPIVLDDFSDLRTNAALPNPENPPQPLWYPERDASNPVAANGTLTVDVNGSPQIYFRSADDSGWYFLRSLIESGTWSDNGFNRLRFRVKQPPGAAASSTGGHNVEIGTFLHAGSNTDGPWSGSDDNNWHFYHFLDIPSDGLWYQVILDTYPDHQRSAPGNQEHGDWEFPENDGQYNYFSMMTSFYYDIPYENVSQQIQLGQFSFFYEDNATVPLAQVRSLNAAFDPATSTVKLGWFRRKDQSGHAYSVAWSYAPIASFADATLAGSFSSPDTDAYNGVHYQLTEPDFANHPLVYVAIQPQGASSFRQIAVELQ